MHGLITHAGTNTHTYNSRVYVPNLELPPLSEPDMYLQSGGECNAQEQRHS